MAIAATKRRVTVQPKEGTVGWRLRHNRKKLGLTIEAFAKTIGIEKDRLSKYERNERSPPLPIVEAIAEQFGMTPGELAFGDLDAELKELEAKQETDPIPGRDELPPKAVRAFNKLLKAADDVRDASDDPMDSESAGTLVIYFFNRWLQTGVLETDELKAAIGRREL